MRTLKNLCFPASCSIFCAIFATVLLLLSLPASAASTRSPESGVEQFHASLLGVMKRAKEIGIKGRFSLLEPQIARNFDIRLMIALASGVYWRKATSKAKKRLADSFLKFSAATYAARFTGFSGESFETVSTRKGPRGTQLIRTRLNLADGESVPLIYVTRLRGDNWLIADVLLEDGISEIAIRRSEYRNVLRKDGIPALIRLLDAKTRKLLGP
jgi:phospholipid transport system substrate-binding protein